MTFDLPEISEKLNISEILAYLRYFRYPRYLSYHIYLRYLIFMKYQKYHRDLRCFREIMEKQIFLIFIKWVTTIKETQLSCLGVKIH